jgi:putative glutamine amidotransferase
MPTQSPPPRVLLPACGRLLGDMAFHTAGYRYVEAVRLAGCLPLVVPAASEEEIDALLDLADGIFLTGSPSNVHPRHFAEAVHDPSLPLDEARDAWTLKLIPRALACGLPLLAICRGFQEMNVALGGSLHQAVHEAVHEGLSDHRAPPGEPESTRYGPAHSVQIAPGGLLARLHGAPEAVVNSVHGQGVRQLAPGLRIEALAPDGLVEAFTVDGAPGFNLGVQWHPEYRAAENPFSMALLAAFGAACRERQSLRPDLRPPSHR